MTFADWAVINKSFVQYPPADLLIAGYLGYKSPDAPTTKRDAAKANTEALKAIPFASGRKKTLAQMPEYIRTPELAALIEKMKLEAAG